MKYTDNEASIFIYAARYAHHRDTGAALMIVNQIIGKWDKFNGRFKSEIKREAKEATFNQEIWARLINH